jgi:hemolysin activation/secretion protein
LLSSQQFGLGGKRFGRGYEPSEMIGDNGVGFTVEPRVDLPLSIPSTQTQAYAFYDVGKVWTKAPLAGQAAHESLSSAGIGVRFQIGAHVAANFEIAKPLTHDIASQGNRKVRPLFSLSTSF